MAVKLEMSQLLFLWSKTIRNSLVWKLVSPNISSERGEIFYALAVIVTQVTFMS
jgi:hypothetical protein